MTATNHALTGALIGLTISNPVLALPLAFLSHFALDAIPHFDPPGNEKERLGAKSFPLQLLADATLCFLLVVALALSHPRHWLTAAISAFLATSPDLFWIPKFVAARRSGKLLANTNWFWRFHSWIQWRTSPKLIWVEVVWFVVFGSLIAARLWNLPITSVTVDTYANYNQELISY